MSLLSDEKRKKVSRLIDAMQSNLVELYDIMNELRSNLDDIPLSDGSKAPIFSEVRIKRSVDEASESDMDTMNIDENETQSISTKSTSSSPASAETRSHDIAGEKLLNEARVSRVLDPITFELQNSSSPAEIVAEYVQSAKDELITDRHSHSKVAQDMDIVLKFLRARGQKPIKPDERENILRRIRRWHEHLLSL